jgi:acyl carrier protein
MAARVGTENQRRWTAAGVMTLEPEDALKALEAAIRSGRPHLAAIAADWNRVAATSPPRVAARLLARVDPSAGRRSAAGGASAALGAFRRELDDAAPDDRLQKLAAHVRDQVRRVLGMPAGAPLRAETGFADLGMDSLMSVELSNRLRESLACSLPATLAFEHPNVERLVQFIAREVLDVVPSGTAPAEPPAAEQERIRLLEAVEQLSDDEAARTLAEELDGAGY